MIDWKAGALKPVAGLIGCMAIWLGATAAQADTATNFSRTTTYSVSVLTPQADLKFNKTQTSKNRLGAAGVSLENSQTFGGKGLDHGQFAVAGNASIGKLGVGASASDFVATAGSGTILSAMVFSSFSDTWTPMSNDPALNDGKHHVMVNYQLHVSGAMSSSAKGLQQFPPTKNFVDSDAEVGLFFSGFGSNLPLDGEIANTSSAVSSSGFPGSAHMPLMTDIDIKADIVLGVATPVTYSLSEVASIGINDQAFKSGASGSASFDGDFEHTLKFVGLSFTDENGNPLSNVTLTSASGFNYMHPSFSAAPEPTSWALMIGGFGLVGAAARSQRRKHVAATA